MRTARPTRAGRARTTSPKPFSSGGGGRRSNDYSKCPKVFKNFNDQKLNKCSETCVVCSSQKSPNQKYCACIVRQNVKPSNAKIKSEKDDYRENGVRHSENLSNQNRGVIFVKLTSKRRENKEISPLMTAEARATFLAKLVAAKMNLENENKMKPGKSSMKTCHECDFNTNSMPILTKHRVLMHAGRRPPQARGRKRKADSAPGTQAKRQSEDTASSGQTGPTVNAIYLADSQELASQDLLADSQVSQDVADTTLAEEDLADALPPTQESISGSQRELEMAATEGTQEFDNNIQERLDLLEEDDGEDEVFDDDNEYEEEDGAETEASSTVLSNDEVKNLLMAARTSQKGLLKKIKDHEEEKCADKIADLKVERERIRLQLMKTEKDKEVEMRRREKAESVASTTREEVKEAKSIANQLQARLSLKNDEVKQLRMQAGANNAKMLSMQGAMMSPPPQVEKASAARPAAERPSGHGKPAKRPPKETKCRNSDRDQQCSRPRCGFFHPSASDHCKTFLQGGSCLRQTCMQRHNDKERQRYQQEQRSNTKKRTRNDSGGRSSKRRRSSSTRRGSPTSRRQSTRRSSPRRSSQQRATSPQSRRDVSDYSSSTASNSAASFSNPGRTAAGRYLSRTKSNQPSRR